MKILNRIACVAVLIAMMLTLVACNNNVDVNDAPEANTEVDEYGAVEGYYTEWSYEVLEEDGGLSELIFTIYTDEEKTDAVGIKEVSFENNEVVKYTINIGRDYLERHTTYVKNEFGEYYSTTEFSADGIMSKTVWENITVNAETGDVSKSVGNQSFHENGKVKTEYHELYINDVLDSKTTKEYDENGVLISETVE